MAAHNERELLHSFVHEFRGLYPIIAGYCKLLILGEFGQLNKEQLKAINSVYKRANQVHDYIEEQMAFLNADEGRHDE